MRDHDDRRARREIAQARENLPLARDVDGGERL
jgi:hypothetical protein